MVTLSQVLPRLIAAGPTEGGASGPDYGKVAMVAVILLAFIGLSVFFVRLFAKIDDRRSGHLTRLGFVVLGLVLFVIGQYWGLFIAPQEKNMGDVGRILYAHVPSVWIALVGLTTNFVASLLYLFKNSWKLDALAEASAEVGVIIGANGVLLGAIWGRPTWGVWWDWDPRLTTAAIMLVAYAGYLALRKFVEDPERRAVWSAVVGVVAFVDLPILWFSVKWWRSLHQVQSSPGTVSGSMTWPLRINAFAFLFLALAFIWYRYRIALRTREEEVALPSALPPDTQVTP